MNNELKQLEGLSPENRRKILAETENKYKSVMQELQELIEYVDDQFNQSLKYKEKDMELLVRSLLSVIHIEARLLTDVRLILNKIYNEHSVELHCINLNLEILNGNIGMVNDKVSERRNNE